MRESTENYLETILILLEEKGNIRAIDIAKRLGFSKASVSVALKKFREEGYIEIRGDGHISLTKEGKRKAMEVYDKHKVLTEALKLLGVSDKIAREDACKIEHHISSTSFKAIKKYLKGIREN